MYSHGLLKAARPELVEGAFRTASGLCWGKQICGVLLVLAVLAGCAGPAATGLATPASEASSCIAWYSKLDEVTQQARVSDGSAHRLPGYPFLRSDRFLASFGDDMADNPAAFETWVGRLAQLDSEARAVELSNLPPQFLPQLATYDAADKQRIQAQTQRCANEARLALLTSAPMGTATGEVAAAASLRTSASQVRAPSRA